MKVFLVWACVLLLAFLEEATSWNKRSHPFFVGMSGAAHVNVKIALFVIVLCELFKGLLLRLFAQL